MPIEASDARGGYQITLPKQERELLAQRIREDHQAAVSDHTQRLNRAARLYKSWRQRYEANDAANRNTPNLQVPLVKWTVSSKIAKFVEAVFGDDAEIVASPVGPSDASRVRKISRYMTWRVFNSMKLVKPLAEFVFRIVLYGRAHAYVPWVRDTYKQYTPAKPGVINRLRRALRKAKEAVYYEGPGFLPLSPDELITPAERVRTVHEFSFLIRPYTVSAGRMRDDARKGVYHEKWVTEHYQELVTRSRELPEQTDRSEASDPVLTEVEKGEKVNLQDAPSARQGLRVWEWYGKWRMLKPGRTGAAEDDLENREAEESEIVVRYLPEQQEIVSVQDLADLYPQKRHRRPFVEGALIYDGSYWCQGVGEMLEELELELSQNEQLATMAGALSVGPIIFYKPASGSAVVKGMEKYEPFSMIPVDNPEKDVKVVTINANLQHTVLRSQAITTYAERVSGESDLTLGRSLERPNAPKTATGTVALLEQGNIRAALDLRFLREDLAGILRAIWELDSDLAPDQLFFRVSEEEAQGLFVVRSGGATMDRTDRTGEYDFSIKFATSPLAKQQRKQDQLALYQADLGNPLVVNSARALWQTTNDFHREWGDENFAKRIPEPPEDDLPLAPKEEHVRILQGEQLEPRPGDNDQVHLIEHHRMLERWRAEPPETRDEEAIAELDQHYRAHIGQMQQKKLMQAMTQQLAQNLETLMPQLAPLTGEGGQPGGNDGFAGSPPGAPNSPPGSPPGAGGPAAGVSNGAGLPQSGGLGL